MSVKRDSAHVRRLSSKKLRRIPKSLLRGSDGSSTEASVPSHISESSSSRSTTEEETSATSTDLYSDGCIAPGYRRTQPKGKTGAIRHTHHGSKHPARPVSKVASDAGSMKKSRGPLVRYKSNDLERGSQTVVITTGMPSITTGGRSHSSTVGSDTKAERDEEVVKKIARFFNPYESVITRLKGILVEHSHRHRLDESHLLKLLQWIDWDPSRLQVVSQAWSHEQFWPFVSSVVASRMVQEFPPLVVARLSSSKAGMITITRLDLRSKHHSRGRKTRATHKQHNVIAETGGLLAVRTTMAKESMNFNELLNFLNRQICPYCLNNICDVSTISNQHEECITFRCGHTYHASCLLFGRHCELCHDGGRRKDVIETSSTESSRTPISRGYVGTGISSASESSPVARKDHSLPSYHPHFRSDSDGSVATVTSSVMGDSVRLTPTPAEATTGFSVEYKTMKKTKPSRRTDRLIRREAVSLSGKSLRSAAETPSSERVKMISMMMDQDGSDLVKVGHKSASKSKHRSLRRSGRESHHRQQSSGGDPEKSSAKRSREVRRKFGGYRRR